MSETRDVTAVGLRLTVLRGAVRAEVDGEAVALGGPTQRRLLAALLADHGTIVTADRLVEAIWPEAAAPDGARKTVMSYVSRLRSAIGGEHLVTRDSGYCLVLDAASFDAAEFEVHLAEGRAEEGAAALAAYDRGLALWSGRAFGDDADEWWLRPVAARLEELHLVAFEERAELLIAASRHADAVADLEQLVAEQPLRERFVELLMRALYLGGRQAEALRAYRRFHDYLADETGLVPSAELADLEHRIVLGHASLAPATGVAVPGYELGEVIGEGAFGAVYRAVQPSVGREVAVKVVRAELADDPRFVQRFEAEAQLVARIEHPHVVPLYDFWRRPGGAFLVFRLLRGGSLADRIADGPMPIGDVTRLVGEVAGALAAAHALGVVHRDVKPANVLYDDAGNGYLADFGIAVVSADADDLSLRSAGSPMYASPEQARDGTATAASDQYALGVVTWEALAGRAPFDGNTTVEVLRAKLVAPVPPLSDGDGGVPSALSIVLQRATAPNAGDRFPSVTEFAAAFLGAVAGRAVDAARTTGRLEDGAGAGTASATVSQLPTVVANPFKGLRAFREADAAQFHGRDELVARLMDACEAGPFVTVVGPSGSGKSSLVHAGVVPTFRRRGALVVSMVPGADPFVELEAALRRVATVDDESSITARLRTPGGLAAVAAELVQPGGQLVLVIDQFEELWTLVGSEAVRDRFADLLAHGADDPGPLHVIATLRADLYDRPLQHPVLGAIVSGSTFAVTPMSSAELAQAIEQPVVQVGIQFEPGLVATMVSEVAERPGALPLLQFTLTELYERRTGATITAAAYEELGGIGGALARRAEHLHSEFDEAGRIDVRTLFTQLVTPGEEADDLRRRASFEELEGIEHHVIEQYTANRLLVTDHHPITREPTVEVAHEALLREWPRLRSWIDDERDAIRQRRSLGRAAVEWSEQGRDESALLRGTRLVAADEIAEGSRLTAVEREFVGASRVLADRERIEAETRSAQQKQQNLRLRRLVTAAAIALAVALLAGAVAVSQRGQARDAASQARRAAAASQRAAARSDLDRLIADAKRLAPTNPDLARLLAAEAAHRAPGALTADALSSTLAADPDLVTFLGDTNQPRVQDAKLASPTGWPAFSPDSTEVAIPDQDAGEIRIVAVTSGKEQRRLPIPVLPDGEVVVTTHWSRGGIVVLVGRHTIVGIDAETGAVRLAPTTVPGAIREAPISDDGRWIAAIATRSDTEASVTVIPLVADGGLRTREIVCCTKRATVGSGGVNTLFVGAVAWRANDLYVASGTGTIEQWDPRTVKPVRSIGDGFGVVWRMVFAPDGSRLYVNSALTVEPATSQGLLQAYAATDWAPIWAHAAPMLGMVADDPRHHAVRVADAFSGKGLYTLDRATGAAVGRTFTSPTGAQCVPYLSPDSSYLMGASCDRSALTVWSLDGGGALFRVVTRPMSALPSFNRSGTHGAITSPSGVVDVDLRTGKQTSMPGLTAVIYGSTGRLFGGRADGSTFHSKRPVEVPSSTFAVDETGPSPIAPISVDVNDEAGRYVISYDPLVLEVQTTSAANRHIATVSHEAGGITSYALSADAERLFVTGTSDLQVYDLDDPNHPHDAGIPAGHLAVAPDRRLLVVSEADGTITFRDPDTLKRIGEDIPGGPQYPAMALAPDASTVATVSSQGRLQLYDVEARRELGLDVPVGSAGLVISPDSSEVYVVRGDALVAMSLHPRQWLAAACQSAGRNLTKVEWATYVGGSPRRTCAQWPAPR